MKVERATFSDAPQIESLWRMVFGDEQEEIRAFLSRFLEKETALIIRDETGIASMLFLIEAMLQCGDTSYRVGYIYAGATRPSERGRGLYKQLLLTAEAKAVERGMYAVFLQPADGRLARTYERSGYTIPLYAHALKGQPMNIGVSERLSADAYGKLRAARLKASGFSFVDWPTDVYEHCMRWCVGGCTVDHEDCVLLSDDQEARLLEKVPNNADVMMRAVGLMKPLACENTMFCKKIYMGYAMD